MAYMLAAIAETMKPGRSNRDFEGHMAAGRVELERIQADPDALPLFSGLPTLDLPFQDIFPPIADKRGTPIMDKLCGLFEWIEGFPLRRDSGSFHPSRSILDFNPPIFQTP